LLFRSYRHEALDLMSRFKGLFDPDDLLNPGVIVRPQPLDADLRRPAAAPEMASDGFAFAADHGNFTDAIHRCVGIGKCRADERNTGWFMCKSFIGTRQEHVSTHGRRSEERR